LRHPTWQLHILKLKTKNAIPQKSFLQNKIFNTFQPIIRIVSFDFNFIFVQPFLMRIYFYQ